MVTPFGINCFIIDRGILLRHDNASPHMYARRDFARFWETPGNPDLRSIDIFPYQKIHHYFIERMKKIIEAKGEQKVVNIFLCKKIVVFELTDVCLQIKGLLR